MHMGIVDALEFPRPERLKKIESTLSMYPLPDLAAEEIARVIRLDYDEKRSTWVTTQSLDPSLLALAKRVKK